MKITYSKIADDVKIGDGCQFVFPVNIYGCTLGDHVKVGPFVEIQNDCFIGSDTVIQSHSFIAAGTVIGINVFIGHGVMTCNDRYPRANNPGFKREPAIIGSDVSIGSGAVILPGVLIHIGAKIGAGAIVTKAVGPYETVVGRY